MKNKSAKIPLYAHGGIKADLLNKKNGVLKNMTTSVFPLTFQSHIIFCAIAVAFFVFQFARQKHAYQLLTVFAVLATLLLYVNESKYLFYGVGIFELVIMITIGILISIAKKKQVAEEKAMENQENENSNS